MNCRDCGKYIVIIKTSKRFDVCDSCYRRRNEFLTFVEKTQMPREKFDLVQRAVVKGDGSARFMMDLAMNTPPIKIEINIKTDNDFIKICDNIPGIETRHQYGVWNYYLEGKQILHANIFSDGGEGNIYFYVPREEIVKAHMERWALLEEENISKLLTPPEPEELTVFDQLEI